MLIFALQQTKNTAVISATFAMVDLASPDQQSQPSNENGYSYGSFSGSDHCLNGNSNADHPDELEFLPMDRKPLTIMLMADTVKNDAISCLHTLFDDDKEKELLRNEMTAMVVLAAPIIITCLLGMLPGIVTIILVGRIDYGDAYIGEFIDNDSVGEGVVSEQKLHMDAAALAVMFFNVVALSPGFGECEC